jgi:hypothetical protein
MNSLIRMMIPGRRSLKSVAAMGAATWAMNRLAPRSPMARRGVRAMNTASWALPLGMMAYRQLQARRGPRA